MVRQNLRRILIKNPESLYVAEVSPVHKITFSAEFSSLQLNLPLAHMNRRDF